MTEIVCWAKQGKKKQTRNTEKLNSTKLWGLKTWDRLRRPPPPLFHACTLCTYIDLCKTYMCMDLHTYMYFNVLHYCNSIVAFTTNWKFWCCCIHCLFCVNEYQRLVYTHTFPFIPKYVLCFHWLYALFMNTRLVTMSVSLRTQTVLRCLIIQVLNTMSLLSKCLTHALPLL